MMIMTVKNNLRRWSLEYNHSLSFSYSPCITLAYEKCYNIQLLQNGNRDYIIRSIFPSFVAMSLFIWGHTVSVVILNNDYFQNVRNLFLIIVFGL